MQTANHIAAGIGSIGVAPTSQPSGAPRLENIVSQLESLNEMAAQRSGSLTLFTNALLGSELNSDESEESTGGNPVDICTNMRRLGMSIKRHLDEIDRNNLRLTESIGR